MARGVTARFAVDHPVRPGAVRAILDTLVAQGGAYEPHLMRRSPDGPVRRISWSRPAGLLDDVTEAGTQTTFLRVAEGQPHPVLSFHISRSPRSWPSVVRLMIPEEALAGSQEIERVLGVCKGLYLFLESPWGTVSGGESRGGEVRENSNTPICWANFIGPELVTHVGPARLLTSLAFMVEILPDGGIMLVTHAAPWLADAPEGRAFRIRLGESVALGEALASTGLLRALHEVRTRPAGRRSLRQLP
ncbi:MAG: hypothetical protein QN120_13750 [Armatimonadota bacterium]|nr:hypothetical protein [Armatimonadota bacterium]